MSRALDDLLVLDTTTSFWAAAGVALLADLGARVIRIELLDEPGPPPRLAIDEGIEAAWDYRAELVHRNKRSLAVDVRQEAGAGIVRELLRKADVFVTDAPRARAEAHGWGYDRVAALNPDIVYARGSGFGPEGPDRDQPPLDELAAARTGMMPVLPQPGQPPVYTGTGQMYSSAMLAFGVMTALRHRQETGEGQEVDVSLFAGNMYGASLDLQAYLAIRGERFLQPVSRLDAGNPMSGPMYPASDGRWVTLTMPDTDRYWPAFAECVGLDPADPRFDSHEKRCEVNRRELMRLLEEAFGKRPSSHWKKEILDRGLSADVIEDYSYPAGDRQAANNGYIFDVEQPGIGTVKTIGFPIYMSETPARLESGAPGRGQHSAQVLQEVLAYADGPVAELRGQGVVA